MKLYVRRALRQGQQRITSGYQSLAAPSALLCAGDGEPLLLQHSVGAVQGISALVWAAAVVTLMLAGQVCLRQRYQQQACKCLYW
jgi:hypothetical protein